MNKKIFHNWNTGSLWMGLGAFAILMFSAIMAHSLGFGVGIVAGAVIHFADWHDLKTFIDKQD